MEDRGQIHTYTHTYTRITINSKSEISIWKELIYCSFRYTYSPLLSPQGLESKNLYGDHRNVRDEGLGPLVFLFSQADFAMDRVICITKSFMLYNWEVRKHQVLSAE